MSKSKRTKILLFTPPEPRKALFRYKDNVVALPHKRIRDLNKDDLECIKTLADIFGSEVRALHILDQLKRF